MLSHLHFRIFLTVIIITAITGITLGFFISTVTGTIVSVTSLIIIFSAIIFTRKRYADLKALSLYLRKISNGAYSLDVRDNNEGELSILKSEIYKVTSMLSEQTLTLEADKRHLTNAISDVSHQLKTPLTSMLMMADLLSSDSLPNEQRITFTNTISNQLDRMEWLVSALLKLAKIDAGTVQFQSEATLISHIITQSLESVSIPIDIKQLEVSIIGDPEISIVTDKNWTSEALINLLKNAVTHTPDHGTIVISSAVNSLYTEIKLQNSGPAIPASDLPYIFKRFYRGENATADSVGIGLAMAHEIITKQNGTIDVTSTPDTGTTFTIKFWHQRPSSA